MNAYILLLRMTLNQHINW